MNELSKEKTQAKLLAVGSIAVTVFMIANAVTDPVNAPKFFILGALGFGCASILVSYDLKAMWASSKSISLVVILFLTSSIVTLFSSDAPMSQSLYGVYGRNNGFIAYISLAFILLAATSLRNKHSYSWIVYGLLISGLLNVCYCAWVILFGDFMGWNNSYNNLLGTFGNPNFIGSFLSIFATASAAYIISHQVPMRIRVILGVSSVVAVLEMLRTNVMQGKVVLALGILLVVGAVIRSKATNYLITWAYFALVGVVGVVAVLGILQKGPLTKYIYQYTVSLRGQYWNAGFNAGKDNLLSGVGFDSLGDWYRRTRSAQALITPGADITTNSAHNVMLDIFAFGGLPLLVSYLALIVLTMKSIVSRFVSKKEFDPIFVALTVGWIGYQAQSVISINQLGLAIWGWLLSGAIIGYVRLDSEKNPYMELGNSSRKEKRKNASPISPGLIAGIGILSGSLISVPPLSADMNFRNAQVSRSAEKLEQALQPSYMHPQSTTMYLNSIALFEESGLSDTALRITKNALAFNQDSFETWRALYSLRSASESDKIQALRNMKRLDPLNKNPAGIKE